MEFGGPTFSDLSKPCIIATANAYIPLTKIPYGQLPEVPFAVGIPVVGLGAAALLLKRKMAH